MEAKPSYPWHFGETGLTAKELEDLQHNFETTPIEEMFPTDSLGNRVLHGNSVAQTYERMPVGVISTGRGRNDPAEDPAVSQAQNRAMHAAAAGHSTLGIPKSVGQEFVRATHGHKVSDLPEVVRNKKGPHHG